MAIPKTSPARIQIQEVSPQVDCGRWPVKRTVGDTVEVTARIFRDGHETLGAAVRHRRPGRERWSETPLEPLGNDLWAGSFEVDRPGLWSFRIDAWIDRVASFQEELRRKVAAGQTDLTSELSEGAALLGDEELTVETALAAPAGDALREGVVGDVLGGRRPRRSPASARGTSSSRARGAASPECASTCRASPSSASTSSTCRRSTRSDARTARAGTTPRRAEPGDVGSPWAIGAEEGGHDAIDPIARHREGAPRPRRRREEARDRDRARLRDPVLARPPVAERASRVVPPPPRRDAEVRREPAEAVPGHLQRRLRERGLARPLAGAARRRPPLGRSRHHRLPRRQPAHEAAARSGSG